VTRIPSAACQADGTFSLDCPPGSYKVTVTPPKGLGRGALPPTSKSGAAIPEAYRDAVKTSLRAEVPAGGTDDLVLELK
jgi:hypothetical protein